MRVLMVSERWFPTVGGGEYHIDSLTRELAGMGVECVILTRDLVANGRKGKNRHEIFHHGKVEVVRLPFQGKFENPALRLTYPPLCTALGMKLAGDCDVIHGQSILAGLPVRWLSFLSKRPSVYTVHGFWHGRWNELVDSPEMARLYQDMERLITFQKFNRTITVDMQMKRTAGSLGEDATRTEYIPNGVDLDKFAGGKNVEPGSLLFVGRLVNQKGLIYLLKALSVARRMGVEPTLDIVGEGPLERKLKEASRTLNLEGQVRFLKKVDDKTLVNLYKTRHIFVLPSLWEGLPLTLLEAWSASMPVITTAVGGIPDVATNEADSLIVASKDHVGLAKAIVRLVKEPSLADELGIRGRELVSREYTWEKCARRTLDVYRSVIEEAKY